MERATVLVADDHAIYRDGLVRLLAALPALEIVAEAADGRTALETIRRRRPAIAVLDLQLPELDGIAVLEAVQREHLPSRGVIVSAYDDSAMVYRAIAAGAHAYVPKTASNASICDAVAAVARGETVLPPETHAGIAAEIRMRRAVDDRPLLTPRELDILRLAADGLSTAAIANELHISAATVKTHLQHAFEKLEVTDRAAAVARALRAGLLHYQGIAIVAWVGVALAHVNFLRARRLRVEGLEFRPGRIPPFNPGGILAWVAATGVGVVLKVEDTAASQFFDTWGLLLTFAIAFGVYTLALRAARPAWFEMRRPHDPIDEVGDPWQARIRCHACDRSYVAREMDRDPSAGHQAICAACATGPAFYAAARREATVRRT